MIADIFYTFKILKACGLWDIDYNSDNWEPEFMTSFVTWQLRVTLDSIRNSCDVFINLFWGGSFGNRYFLHSSCWMEHLHCGFQVDHEQAFFEIYLSLLFANR